MSKKIIKKPTFDPSTDKVGKKFSNQVSQDIKKKALKALVSDN